MPTSIRIDPNGVPPKVQLIVDVPVAVLRLSSLPGAGENAALTPNTEKNKQPEET